MSERSFQNQTEPFRREQRNRRIALLDERHVYATDQLIIDNRQSRDSNGTPGLAAYSPPTSKGRYTCKDIYLLRL